MKLLVLLTLFFSQGLLALENTNRPSYFSLSGTRGPDSYQSYIIETKVGMDPKWSIGGSYFQSDSGIATLLNEPFISKEIRADIDWQINKTWGVAIGAISRQDPYEIIGQGAFLSARANINNWWKGKKKSTLTINYESLRITQDVVLQGRFVSFNIQKDLEQKNTSISFDQEILDWLELSLSHSKYSYSEKTNDLALTTSKRRTAWGGSSTSYGYPEVSNSLEFQINPKDWFELRLGASQTKILGNDTKTQSSNGGLTFYWESFQFDMDYSRTDYGSTSGTSEQVQDYSSLGIGYNW